MTEGRRPRATSLLAYDSKTPYCVLSTGTGFIQPITLTGADPGYDAGRAWADFNGDRMGDYCRVVGGWWYKMIQCTVSTGAGFGDTFTSGAVDPGYDAGRAWVDFNGDGRSDYCRIVGSSAKKAQCTLSNGDGFGDTITSGTLDPGWDAGRAWTDVNGDGRADYCRVVGMGGTSLQCTLSAGTEFGQSFTSATLDAGYDDSRGWADVNGDRRADYCRIVGSAFYSSTTVRCTVSTGNNFGASFTSPAVDAGYSGTQGWADVNGDGSDDFCRLTDSTMARCTVSLGTSFGDTFSATAGAVGALGWVDFNGDGRADLCQRSSPTTAACMVSNGNSFGQTFSGSW